MELLRRITVEELQEWKAYWQLEPFGPWADNLNLATLVSVVVNALRGKKGRVLRPRDIALGDYSDYTPKQTAEEQKSSLLMLAKALGAKIKKKDKKKNG